MEEPSNSAALFPGRAASRDDPWLLVPEGFADRSRRLARLPAADLILACMFVALALVHN